MPPKVLLIFCAQIAEENAIINVNRLIWELLERLGLFTEMF